ATTVVVSVISPARRVPMGPPECPPVAGQGDTGRTTWQFTPPGPPPYAVTHVSRDAARNPAGGEAVEAFPCCGSTAGAVRAQQRSAALLRPAVSGGRDDGHAASLEGGRPTSRTIAR